MVSRVHCFADNGWFAVDSDDGSYKYNISSNVMVWGGCKNYLSADKGCGPDNVILYPGAKNRTGTESFSGCQSDYTTGSDPIGTMWNQCELPLCLGGAVLTVCGLTRARFCRLLWQQVLYGQ